MFIFPMNSRRLGTCVSALILSFGALLFAVEVRAFCRAPPKIANGFIQIDNNYGQESGYLSRPGGPGPYDTVPTNFRWHAGDTILYSCHDGFKLAGNKRRICERSGSWTGTEPQCAGGSPPRTCPAPNTPSNGYITPTARPVWYVGDSFRVRCHDGFEEPIPNYFSCRVDGTWSSGSVNCRRRPATCNSRLVVLNGYVDTPLLNGWTVGTVVSVKCYRGFQEPTPNRFECVFPGRWSPPRGVCAEARPDGCPSPPGIDNGYLSSDRNRQQHTGTMALMADTGSEGASIRWNPNDVVLYGCDQGYALIGSRRRVCTREGIWTGVRAQCEYIGFIFRTSDCDGGGGESFCDSPLELLNGTFVREVNDVGAETPNPDAGRWAANDMIKYRCDDGFALVGDLRRVCTCEGYWTGDAPECLPKSPGLEGRGAEAGRSEDAGRTPHHCSSDPCHNGCACEENSSEFSCRNVGETMYLGHLCQYDPPGVSCGHDRIDVSISSVLVDGMNGGGGGGGFFYLASGSSSSGPPAAAVGCRFEEYNLNMFLATIEAPFVDCGIRLEPVDQENFSRSVTIWHNRSGEALPTSVADILCVYEGLYDVSIAIDALCCASLPLITANGVFHFQTSLWKDPPGPGGSDILPDGRRREQVKGLDGAVAYTVGNMLYVTITMNSGNADTGGVGPKLRTCWMSPEVSSSEAVPVRDLILYPRGRGTEVRTWGPTSTPNAVHFGFQLHQAKESSRLYLHCQIEVVAGRERRSVSDEAAAQVLTKGPIYVTAIPDAHNMQQINGRYGVEDIPHEMFLAVCIFGTLCILLLTACCYAHLRLLHNRSSGRCARLASVTTVS